MKTIYRSLLIVVLVLAFILAPSTPFTHTAKAAAPNCADSTAPLPATYTVTVCISAPADGFTFSTNGTITATYSVVGGTDPGVRRMQFSLGSSYLLTDFITPFTFTLPVTRYADGTYTLSVNAVMKDTFVTNTASITIHLASGTVTPQPSPNTFHATSGTTPAAGQPFVLAAAGDGAGGEPNAATVTNLISSMNPNLFLYVGDVYDQGSEAEFFNWYAPDTYFGRFKAITDPTVGNHDYGTGTSEAYRFYWDNIPDYYSFDAAGWHFISLNSYSQFISVNTSSAEYIWLQQDLAAHTNPCTIAYFHHPYLSIGTELGRANMVDIWKLLAQNSVDIVLNGHDHEYQRWVPLNANAQPSRQGMTEFVIATGGHSMQNLVTTDSRVAFASDAAPLTYGALKLELHSTYAAFNYMSMNGTSLDSGTIPCSNPSMGNAYYFPVIMR